MNRVFYISVCGFLLKSLLFINLLLAQSIHFSQFNELPSAFNPASTGLIPDGNYRVLIIQKNQWNSIPVSYNTYGVNSDLSIYTNKTENSWLGIGGYIMKDEGGDGNLSNTRWQGSLAYHTKLNEYSTFSSGLTFGSDKLSIHKDKLTYAEQWDGSRYNIQNNSKETIPTGVGSYQYINIGVNYTTQSEERNYLRVGYSAMNVNKPVYSFLGTYSPIAIRHLVNVEGMYKTTDRLIYTPVLYFNYQAKAIEILIGSGVKYKIGPSSKSQTDFSSSLLGGMYYRFNDAIIPFVGYESKNYKFVLGYDITASSLSQYNQASGGFEILMSIKGFYNPGNPSSVQFTCPRF